MAGENRGAILIVDDLESDRFLMETRITKLGFAALGAAGGEEALALLRKRSVALILSDMVMPGLDGLALLREVRARHGDLPFIMITAHGGISNAVAAIKQGADDYITKPVDLEELRAVVERALSYGRLTEENRLLKEHLRELYSFQNIVTAAPAMKKALRLAAKVAGSPRTTVAIYGESGAGKEALARAIHYAGERMARNFVAVNCAAIPAPLLESELFGHARGAFTGVDHAREGKFDLAQGGTLLLDEIGDMPPELQTRLLRVLEERVYQRLGSNRPIPADFRIISATHRDLARLVAQGRFREDLYHRLNAFPITIPPLRERQVDIPLLAEKFLVRLDQELAKPLPGISRPALAQLLAYPWPGNVRELKNCLERAAILAEREPIEVRHLGLSAPPPAGSNEAGMVRIELLIPEADFSLAAAVDEVISATLKRCGGNKAKTVKMLKVGRNFLYRRK